MALCLRVLTSLTAGPVVSPPTRILPRDSLVLMPSNGGVFARGGRLPGSARDSLSTDPITCGSMVSALTHCLGLSFRSSVPSCFASMLQGGRRAVML